MKGFFVTGTDTGVGKTYISQRLLVKASKDGRTAALKPIASGCDRTDDGLRNDDALRLQSACSEPWSYDLINPIAFEEPIAPHLAAAKQGESLSVDRLMKASEPMLSQKFDYLIVEGAGGWLCPLNEKETLADFAVQLGLPVILVVGLRLGCLNHALLTEKQILSQGCILAGWIGNIIEPDLPHLQGNIDTLKAMLSSECLEIVEHQ